MTIKDDPSKHEKPPGGPAKQSITKALILLLVLWIGLNGCAPGPFIVESGNIYSKTLNISVEIPRDGWHYTELSQLSGAFAIINKEFSNVVMVIEKLPHDFKLPHIKKNFPKIWH